MAGGNMGGRFIMKLRGDIISVPVKAATTIFRGGLVAYDSTGYAVHPGDTASQVFIGIAEEKSDNSAGASGDKYVRVRRTGLAVLIKQAATAVTDRGLVVCCSTQHTSAVDGTVDLIATTTNDVRVGRVLERLPDDLVLPPTASSTYAKKLLLVALDGNA